MIEDVKIIDNNRIEYKGEVLNVPHHIAVIPDGNRRWARERGLAPIFGHKEGVETYKKLLENAADLGVSYVTFYAFSTENWKRNEAEDERDNRSQSPIYNGWSCYLAICQRD